MKYSLLIRELENIIKTFQFKMNNTHTSLQTSSIGKHLFLLYIYFDNQKNIPEFKGKNTNAEAL